MWETLFNRYWQVATLKNGPEDTPFSTFLLSLISFLFIGLLLCQWQLADLKNELSWGRALVAGFFLLSSYYLYTFVLLKIYKKTNRWLQSLSSLLACHFIVHLFALPLLFLTPLLVDREINQALILAFSILYLLATLSLTIWQFLITIMIFKKALNIDSLAALLASLGLFAFNILMVSFWL